MLEVLQELPERREWAPLFLPDEPLAVGGQGRIYEVMSQPRSLAKVYSGPVPPNQGEKVAAMIAQGPPAGQQAQGHVPFAWPQYRLFSTRRQFAGFLMPRITGMRHLDEFWDEATVKTFCPEFSVRNRIWIARNAAENVGAVHEAEHVVVDFSEGNMLANEQGLVTSLDTDSFQIQDGYGRVYPGEVATPEFAPPELLRQAGNLGATVRNQSHDHHGLAVVIFFILCGGHPFHARYVGQGRAPQIEELVAEGVWPFDERHRELFVKPRQVLHYRTYPPYIGDLFRSCFIDGHKKPAKRPTARQWQRALEKAFRELVRCPADPNHWLFPRGICPGCLLQVEREYLALLAARGPSRNRAWFVFKTTLAWLSERFAWLRTRLFGPKKAL